MLVIKGEIMFGGMSNRGGLLPNLPACFCLRPRESSRDLPFPGESKGRDGEMGSAAERAASLWESGAGTLGSQSSKAFKRPEKQASGKMNGKPLTSLLRAAKLQTDLACLLRSPTESEHHLLLEVMGQQALASLELTLALKKKKNHHLPFFFFFLASSDPQGGTLLLCLCPTPLL